MSSLTPGQTADQRPVDQRRHALAKANSIRLRRVALKRDLQAGCVPIGDYIASPPDWLLTATVYEIVIAIPRMGTKFTRRATGRAGISTTDTFEMLTDVTRQALLDELAETPAHKWL